MAAPEIPAFLTHKRSGNGRIKINGRELWLGPADQPAAREKYDRIIAEWLANGRKLPADYAGPKQITISELIVEFMKFAEVEHFKHGQPTKEFQNLKPPLRVIQKLYGSIPAASFGPRALITVRYELINRHLKADGQGKVPKPLSRGHINEYINRIRRVFRWAVSRELIPETVINGLDAIEGLRKGKGGVERPKIRIIPDAFIHAVKPYISRQIWGLIELQLATGMRPGEALCLRGADLNTEGTLWEINPTEHKTAHFGISRLIFVGPKAQNILRQFLKTDLQAYLFSPKDAREERYAALRASRKTKVQPSQNSRRKTNPKRLPAEHYSCDSYRRAIHRACDLADEAAGKEVFLAGKQLADAERLLPRWSPNRLRHNFATRMRREYGIETARILLGHTSASTTEIYAEADRMKAVKVMEEVG